MFTNQIRQNAEPTTTLQTLLQSAGWVGLPIADPALAGTTLDLCPAMDLEALVIEHIPVVRFVARRIAEKLPQHVDLDDLVSAGYLGLLDAAHRFDSNKHVQFKSYAQFRIRGAIMDALRSLDWSPRDLRRKGREIEEATRTLATRLGRTPADSEIAEELELSLTVLHQLTRDIKGTAIGSLDATFDESDGESELQNLPVDPKEDPLAACIAGQTREQLAAAIEMLPERERLVLTLSYHEEMTLKEIGLTLGVVESRASQLRSAAVARLRMLLKGKGKRPTARSARANTH